MGVDVPVRFLENSLSSCTIYLFVYCVVFKMAVLKVCLSHDFFALEVEAVPEEAFVVRCPWAWKRCLGGRVGKAC